VGGPIGKASEPRDKKVKNGPEKKKCEGGGGEDKEGSMRGTFHMTKYSRQVGGGGPWVKG